MFVVKFTTKIYNYQARLLKQLQKRSFTKTLFERMIEIVPEKQAYATAVFAATKDEQLSTVSVAQAFQGMRGVKALVCETSELDANEGIRFRGLTVPDIQQQLPNAKCRSLPGTYPLPEGMLWLLLTGEVPTDAEVKQLSEELTSAPYNILPKHTLQLIKHLPKTQHPMSQYMTTILSLQSDSIFANEYSKGTQRSQYWKHSLTDTLHMLAKIPAISAEIYQHSFTNESVHPFDSSLDWSANWCQMIGFNDKVFHDLMRMYFTIHTDHESGNVSAHATHLVGSALSDPYLSYVAGMCGLAGPLHGLANQESLNFILGIKQMLDADKSLKCTKEFLEGHVRDVLEGGQVIPGFGHAVLKITDPRYMIQREFALEHIPESELFGIVSMLYEVVPEFLKTWKGGRVSNPFPNLDAHSGCLLYEYGLREDTFYTVLFGMSRAIGVLSQFVTDRYLMSPIERPKSVSIAQIAKQFDFKM